jgi:AraC-like DNA-binding protein
MESGFANETSFFRTFKAIVGMTPSEWKSSNQL